jgi:hypothetical protein
VPEVKRPPLLVRMLVAGTMTGIGMIGFLYLTMPNLGIVELIPDAMPFFGNIDEAAATAMILMTMSYWGIDVTALGRRVGNWSAGKPKALPPGSGSKGA